MVHISDINQLNELISLLRSKTCLYLDLETTGLNPVQSKILLLSVNDGQQAYVVDFTSIPDTYVHLFQPLLYDASIKKVFHNAVFDTKFLWHYGCETRNCACTFINESLLTAGLPYSRSLASVAERRLGIKLEKEIRETFTQASFQLTNEHLVYAARDVEVLPAIFDQQEKEIDEQGLRRVQELEFALIRPTMLMEYVGIRVDIDRLRSSHAPFIAMRNKIAKQLQTLYIKQGLANEIVFSRDGYEAIKLSSPKQMLKFLNDMGIDVKSTNAKELTEWDIRFAAKKDPDDVIDLNEMLDEEEDEYKVGFHHPLLRLMAVRSIIDKVMNTYILGIEQRCINGRIYPSFNQLGASATGRYSSSDPNFQNMVKRDRLEAVGLGEYDIRSMFIPDPGNVFIISDYSAIELVIAALFAEDEDLLHNIEKGDVHSYLAYRMFGVEIPPDKKKQHPYSVVRDCSKTLTYAKLYGTTGGNLERTLGPKLAAVGINVRAGDGDRWIARWRETFPKTGDFLQRNAEDAVTKYYVRTVMGRRRNWSPLFESASQFRAAQRQGSNSAIQGSSADMMKLAIVRLYNVLPKHSRIVATIHDELIVETPKEYAEEVKSVVQFEMEEAGRELFPLARTFNVIKAEPKISDKYDK